jgi:cellulose synthase/poly-beta-1,6-N-acetylglucosamine synthase-like glycosyltransferase
MTTNKDSNTVSVDVVIPVYNEPPEALAKTLRACLEQTCPISRIFIVDDGSTEPVTLPNWARSFSQISLLRLSDNQGISAARNQAIACSNSFLLACINAEVVPDPDWLATCESYLSEHPNVCACYTRIAPERPDRLLTRWRMRFHETKFGEHSGPSFFAPGHAVLFRREAVDSVGGYDPRYRRNYEDSDICERMRQSGWETHYVAKSRCISTQTDSLKGLAAKQLLRDTCWSRLDDGSLIRLYFLLTKWSLIRAGRNLLKGRLYFLPIDIGIWACAFWTATIHALSESGVRSIQIKGTSNSK